jgi:hypothetical protein
VEGIADGMIADGISGAIGDIPSIPLGPIGGGLTLTNIILDDLELKSFIQYSVAIPVKNKGSFESTSGFTIDLDTGEVKNQIVAGTDLIWYPNDKLGTNGPAGLTITGLSYGALTAIKISQMPLTTSQIPASLIPLTLPPAEPFLPHTEVVFGIPYIERTACSK